MTFDIWKPVTLGLFTTSAEYREELRAKGMRLDETADRLLDRIDFSPRAVTVNLVRVTPRWLGLLEPRDTLENYRKLHPALVYRDIYRRAQELGLVTCPAEVGPALRCQYQEQPAREGLTVGMAGLVVDEDDDGAYRTSTKVFGIRAELMYKRLTYRWLTAEIGIPNFDIQHADAEWLFIRP